MAQKIPFFELFSDFSPEFELRVLLNTAIVTNMVLEPERRAMTLDMTVHEQVSDAAQTALEQLLARQYELSRVTLNIKSTAVAFPDLQKGAGRRIDEGGRVIMGREIKGNVLPMGELTAKSGRVVVEGKVFQFDIAIFQSAIDFLHVGENIFYAFNGFCSFLYLLHHTVAFAAAHYSVGLI